MIFGEPIEEDFAEAEMSDAYDAVMMNDSAARQAYEHAKSLHLNERNRLMATVIALSHGCRKHRSDMESAASELLVGIPVPGTDMARMIRANVQLRRENARLREEIEMKYEEEAGADI